MGLLAGRFAAGEALGKAINPPPATTAFGSLLHHITGGAEKETFQPMNVNFGLFPPIDPPSDLDKKALRLWQADRKKRLSERALQDIDNWIRQQETLTNLAFSL